MRLQSVPQTIENPPKEQYMPREGDISVDSKNIPEVTTEITNEQESESESESEPPNMGTKQLSEKLSEPEENGVYYIYHPNGLLQRVTYATKDDIKNMKFSAKLMYENVQPITGPVYTYDPETFVFNRI
ncbi:hypothetical protein NQ314_015642 [Rhamnusium bicolor]|uniref:Uncharacterized protein n=1 Tax=Rhamnusium bicolor TaxID=1586634 RepID=A0AAV8WYD9_9CUCU|nr:hypothetical protein NQ314_015642 [Rhamnusium bicolor]